MSYLHSVPRLQIFVEGLGKTGSCVEGRGSESGDEGVKLMVNASRKCVVAVMLSSSRHRTLCVNTNAVVGSF